MQRKVLAGLCTIDVWSLSELSIPSQNQHHVSVEQGMRRECPVPGLALCQLSAIWAAVWSCLQAGILPFPLLPSCHLGQHYCAPSHLHSLISLLLKDLIYAPR